MSLLPIFSPYVSAYRVDNLQLEGTETFNNDCFTFSDGGDRVISDEIDNTTSGWSISVGALSTNWDVTTRGTVSSISFDDLGPTATRGFIGGMVFRNGGLTFIGSLTRSGPSHLMEYTLSSPYAGTSTLEHEVDMGFVSDFFLFSDGGTKIHANDDDVIMVSTLGTPYDISTMSAFTQERSFVGLYTGFQSATWGKTEGQLFIYDYNAGLLEFNLTIPGDISSASFVTSYPLSDGDWIAFGDGGRKFYESTGRAIDQYASVG